MKYIRTFFLLILFGSCSSQENELIVHQLLSDWVEHNPRISEQYSYVYKGGNLNVILKEQSRVSSPDIEKISSDNLVYKIVNSKYDLSLVDTVLIYFDLPTLHEDADLKKQKVNKLYSYDRSQVGVVKEVYSDNAIARATSDYITYNFKNSDELELFQAMNLANDLFKWEFEKFEGGLTNIYEYSFLRFRDISMKERIQLQLAALYKVGETANLNSQYHLDSIYNIFGDIDLSLKLHEIDSIGRRLDRR